MFYECPKAVYIFTVTLKEFWYPVLGTWKYLESEKDVPTCVCGQAKDLTNTLRNVVSDVVYMNENKLL
jgi:hypothetical protein